MGEQVEYIKTMAYQDVDSLVSGAFGDNVLDPGFVHVHGTAVFENSSRCVEVLRTVYSVGTVEKEVARLVGNSCREGTWEALRSLGAIKTARYFWIIRRKRWGSVIGHTKNISWLLPLDDLDIPSSFRNLSDERVTCARTKWKRLIKHFTTCVDLH